MGTSFGIDGTAILSDETFLRVFPHRKQGIIDIGVIRLKPGADAENIRKELAARLPNDVEVLSHQGLVNLERDFWGKSTPVGFVFTLGVTMGIIVGSIIVYQILYTDVSDHLDEYATLKAIGYRDGYLFRIVLGQAALLSVFGFFPGMALSQVVYVIAGNATLLPLRMNTVRCLVVYLLTLIMCMFSGAMAMRKLKSADPAEIF
jgi:putative ABC transport system permease protein